MSAFISLKFFVACSYARRHFTTQRQLSWGKEVKKHSFSGVPAFLFFVSHDSLSTTPSGVKYLNRRSRACNSDVLLAPTISAH